MIIRYICDYKETMSRIFDRKAFDNNNYIDYVFVEIVSNKEDLFFEKNNFPEILQLIYDKNMNLLNKKELFDKLYLLIGNKEINKYYIGISHNITQLVLDEFFILLSKNILIKTKIEINNPNNNILFKEFKKYKKNKKFNKII